MVTLVVAGVSISASAAAATQPHPAADGGVPVVKQAREAATFRDLSFAQTQTPTLGSGETGTVNVKITASVAGADKPATGDSFTMTAPDGFTFTGAPTSMKGPTCTLVGDTQATCTYPATGYSWYSGTIANMTIKVKAGSPETPGTHTGRFVYTPGTDADADLSNNAINYVVYTYPDLSLAQTLTPQLAPGETGTLGVRVTVSAATKQKPTAADSFAFAAPDGFTITSAPTGASGATCTLEGDTKATCAYPASGSSWAPNATVNMTIEVKAASSSSAGTYTGRLAYTPGTYNDANLGNNTITLTGIITEGPTQAPPSGTPSPTPTAPPAAASSAAAPSPGEKLPLTGSPLGVVGLLGTLLLMIGTAIVALVRRRR